MKNKLTAKEIVERIQTGDIIFDTGYYKQEWFRDIVNTNPEYCNNYLYIVDKLERKLERETFSKPHKRKKKYKHKPSYGFQGPPPINDQLLSNDEIQNIIDNL